jgi:hypothetical protein
VAQPEGDATRDRGRVSPLAVVGPRLLPAPQWPLP